MDKKLKEEIIAILTDEKDNAELEQIYLLLKHRFENTKQTRAHKKLPLTDRQQEYIDRAINAKLIEKQPDGSLLWRPDSKVLLAYFCGRVFSGDRTEDDNYWKPGKGRFPAAALERLFHTKLLKQLRNGRLWHSSPKKHEQVDEIMLFQLYCE